MTAGPPWDLSTYDGYRAFLVACGNPAPVVEEILRAYFPGIGPADCMDGVDPVVAALDALYALPAYDPPAA